MSANSDTQKTGKGSGLIVLSWLASILGLPICFIAFIGWSLSATMRPHATMGELLMLFAAPLISAASLLYLIARCKITSRRFAALIVPALLTLVEIVFAFVVWGAG